MELLVRFFWKMTDIGVHFLSELKRRAVLQQFRLAGKRPRRTGLHRDQDLLNRRPRFIDF